MPNHVTNELIFRGVNEATRQDILSKAVNAKGNVDFEILLPIPLNAWQFSSGIRHEKAFKLVALDWCSANWGTKWNAYDVAVSESPKELFYRLDTAWDTPEPVIRALSLKFSTLEFEITLSGEIDKPCTYRYIGGVPV